MQITARTYVHKTVILDVGSSETIAQIKAKIAEQAGITVEKQCIYRGAKTKLADDRTLSEFGINTDSTIYVCKVGGPPPSEETF
jgi:hypothetical protein